MANEADAQHGDDVQAMIESQIQQLQGTLVETMEMARKQNAGVTVRWQRQDAEGRMQVEMMIDTSLQPDEVRYVEAEAKV